jgi:hypothetical protein
MKTGRLMKFHRNAADVQAYLYQDGALFRASLYLMGPGQGKDPVHTISSGSERGVEDAVRAWVEHHYPRAR